MNCEETSSRVRQRGPWGALVLVADDMPEARALCRTCLEFRGLRTEGAEDGPTCLALAVSLRPGLIVLDFSMPRMDGAEVVRRLKSDDRTRAIPIVMLTSIPDAVDAATRAKLAAFLEKPSDPDTLVDIVMGALTVDEPLHLQEV
jgi:CheY-like chemotaxis protein